MAGDAEFLKGVPLWKVVSIAVLGAGFILFMSRQIDAAVAESERRDAAAFVSRTEYQEVRERLIRIEEKVDAMAVRAMRGGK